MRAKEKYWSIILCNTIKFMSQYFGSPKILHSHRYKNIFLGNKWELGYVKKPESFHREHAGGEEYFLAKEEQNLYAKIIEQDRDRRYSRYALYTSTLHEMSFPTNSGMYCSLRCASTQSATWTVRCQDVTSSRLMLAPKRCDATTREWFKQLWWDFIPQSILFCSGKLTGYLTQS